MRDDSSVFCRDSDTIRMALRTVIASTTTAASADQHVRRALVVEGTSREVGPQHQATRSRRITPTDGASASSSSGPAHDAIAQRDGAAEIERLDSRPDALFEARGAAARPPRAPRDDAPASTTRENPPPPSRSS